MDSTGALIAFAGLTVGAFIGALLALLCMADDQRRLAQLGSSTIIFVGGTTCLYGVPYPFIIGILLGALGTAFWISQDDLF
jgi:hypothetical protein